MQKPNLFSLLCWLAVFFLPGMALAQKVTVLDALSGQPIEDVLIYNSSGTSVSSFQTNQKGQTTIDGFTVETILVFRHVAYRELSLTYKQLAEKEFTVRLTEHIIPVNEITVSASKWKEERSEVATDVLTLTSRDINLANPGTSADLLASSGEVFVQKSQLGGGSPMLRGFSANAILLVVDGVRMNNAIYRSGNLQNVINIDPNALESAEVVFGPGSVIYGSDALGGVLNFRTQQPRFSNDEKRYLRGGALLRYASAAGEKTAHAHLSLGKKRISLFSSFTATDYDDLVTGSRRTEEFPDFGKRPFYIRRENGQDLLVANSQVNRQTDSGFALFNMIHKLRVKATEETILEYGYYHSVTSDIPRYDRLIQTEADGSLRYAQWFYGPQNWKMHRLSLENFTGTRLYDQAKINVAYQNYQESRNDRRVNNTSLRNQAEQVGIYSFNADFDKTLKKGSLFYGTEWVYNEVTSSATRTDIETGTVTATGSRYPDLGSSYRSAALYLNYKQRLNKKLVASAGARYSHVKIEAETSEVNTFFPGAEKINLQNGAVNGMLGLVYSKTKNTLLSGTLASGFRSPNIDDVGKVFELGNGEIIVPNPDLKPEYSYNAEISLRKNLKNQFSMDLVVYHSWLRNAITRDIFAVNGSSSIDINGESFTIFAQQNFSRAKIFGAGTRMKYQFSPQWAVSGSVNYTQGRETETDEPLRHVPPVFGNASVVFKQQKLRLEAFTQYSGAVPFSQLAPSERGKTDLYTPDGSLAWITANFRGSYQLSSLLRLSAALENILDTHYRTYSSGISAPGRNGVLSLSATF